MQFFKSLTFAAAAVLLAGPAQAEPILAPASYDSTYIPDGFDSNDQTEIVVEGVFSNACYKPAPPEVKVVGEKVVVQPRAYYYPGFCAQVLVRYQQVIDLGIMAAGNYAVETADGDKLGSMHIKPTTSTSADDFLYAPISQAFYRHEGKDDVIYLTGEFTNSCMKLAQITKDIQKNVIVIQPVAKLENQNNCVTGKFPFSERIEVTAKPGRYLLHVRSLNARAINNLIDIQ